MSERIDHAAEVEVCINYARATESQAEAHMSMLEAQVHATLALVEQQRIANLIALSQATDGNGWQAAEPLDALYGYARPDPGDGFEGLHVRPKIREALGL